VLLERVPASAELQQLEQGIRIGDFKTLPARITFEPTQQRAITREHWLRIAIYEGKNRQVRRMFAAVGCEVRRLIRISIGPLQLGDLPLGAWRELTASEVKALKKACARKKG